MNHNERARLKAAIDRRFRHLSKRDRNLLLQHAIAVSCDKRNHRKRTAEIIQAGIAAAYTQR